MPAVYFDTSHVNIQGDVVKVAKSARSRVRRVSCARCCGHLLCELKYSKRYAVCGGLLPGPFVPDAHHFYSERIMEFADSFPKLQDLALDLGGSGQEVVSKQSPVSTQFSEEMVGELGPVGTQLPDEMNVSCYCGAVKLKIHGPPVARTLCSCEPCRKWSGSTSNAEVLYPRGSVSVQGELKVIERPDRCQVSDIRCCARCFGAVMSSKKVSEDLFGINACLLQGAFPVDWHFYYSERIIQRDDGSPKFEDLPVDLGGSGRMLHEERLIE